MTISKDETGLFKAATVWGNGNIVYLLIMMFVLFIAVCVIEFQFNRTHQQIDRLRLTMIRQFDHSKSKYKTS